MRQITLDFSKIVLGESSEETIESLLEIINEGKEYLKRWTETHVKYYPQEPHEMPPPQNFDLMNCSDSAFATDTCNQAMKSRRVMEQQVNERKY